MADGDIGGIYCAGENGVESILAGAGDLVRESPSPKPNHESSGFHRVLKALETESRRKRKEMQDGPKNLRSMSTSGRSQTSAMDEAKSTGSRGRAAVEEGDALAHAERWRGPISWGKMTGLDIMGPNRYPLENERAECSPEMTVQAPWRGWIVIAVVGAVHGRDWGTDGMLPTEPAPGENCEA
jgi:hypothetical protein